MEIPGNLDSVLLAVVLFLVSIMKFLIIYGKFSRLEIIKEQY